VANSQQRCFPQLGADSPTGQSMRQRFSWPTGKGLSKSIERKVDALGDVRKIVVVDRSRPACRRYDYRISDFFEGI